MACLKKKTGRELVFNQDVELIQSQFCRVLDGLWDAVCSVFSPLPPPPFRCLTEEHRKLLLADYSGVNTIFS